MPSRQPEDEQPDTEPTETASPGPDDDLDKLLKTLPGPPDSAEPGRPESMKNQILVGRARRIGTR